MKGKAAVATSPGAPFDIREYTVPEVSPDDILVKIRLANICGSDLHGWEGRTSGNVGGTGTIPGHEMFGDVYDIGHSVRFDSMGNPLKIGDRIAYSYFRPCNVCSACMHGDAACPYRYRDRDLAPDEYPHFNGAFAQYFYMRSGHWVFKVPDELADELVSPVNCALAEVLYGLHRVGITLGDTVVIQGVGGLGLYATAVAREMGAGQIIVLDRMNSRLRLAEEFGADKTINVDETSSEERIARVREWTGGHGVDVVAELTGVPSVVQEGLDMMRPGGRYLWIGSITPTPAEIIPPTVVRASRTIFGVVVYEKWVIPRALDLLVRTQHRYPYHKIISDKFPLDEINKAFPEAAKRECIHVALTM